MSKFCPLANAVTNCTDNCKQCLDAESAFGSVEIKQKIDAICKLSNEVMALVKDFSYYSDDENMILDAVASFIHAYHIAFD